jgi:hypothetical protein
MLRDIYYLLPFISCVILLRVLLGSLFYLGTNVLPIISHFMLFFHVYYGHYFMLVHNC